MEIVKAKNNNDRAIIRIDHNHVRVVAEHSKQHRISKSRIGLIKMFDFVGGPNFTVGGRFEFEKMFWRVDSISELKSDRPLREIILEISPIYTAHN